MKPLDGEGRQQETFCSGIRHGHPRVAFRHGAMESTDERMAVDFPHNPPPSAWQRLTWDKKEPVEGFDIAIGGERGIAHIVFD